MNKIRKASIMLAAMVFSMVSATSFSWADAVEPLNTVKTGDEMNLGLWIGILVIALAAVGIVAIARLIRRK